MPHHHSRSIILRLFKEKKAATLVEFAVVFPPFFVLFLLVVESAFLYFNTLFLEAGLQAGRRFALTGQINSYQAQPSAEDVANGALTQAQAFRKVFCQNMGSVYNCDSIQFDVRSFDGNGAIKLVEPVVDGKLNTSDFIVNFGNECDIVVVRAFYETKSVAGFFRDDVKKLEGINSIIGVSTAFKNPPFNKC